MLALSTHTNTHSRAYHACAHTLTYQLVHTPHRHNSGSYHYPSNRLVRTLATNPRWLISSLWPAEGSPSQHPHGALWGVAFALLTLKCGLQVSHGDQPSPFYQFTFLRSPVSESPRNHQAPKSCPKPDTWAVKAPGFPCTSSN